MCFFWPLSETRSCRRQLVVPSFSVGWFLSLSAVASSREVTIELLPPLLSRVGRAFLIQPPRQDRWLFATDFSPLRAELVTIESPALLYPECGISEAPHKIVLEKGAFTAVFRASSSLGQGRYLPLFRTGRLAVSLL